MLLIPSEVWWRGLNHVRYRKYAKRIRFMSTASVFTSVVFASSAEYVSPNLICALNGLNAQWMLLFQLTKREETAPRLLLLCSREQWLNGCRVIPASSAEPGLEEKCRLWIQRRDTELWPLSLLNFPLEVFSLIAEKRAGLCFSKKKKKKREGVLIWGMSALPCSPALERVPSRARQCINI